MSDRFDRAMADIAIKSAKNGGPEIKDVLTAMRASHDDSIEVAEKLSVTVANVAEALHREVIEAAKQRMKDIDASAALVRQDLQNYRETQAARCAEEHRKLLEEEVIKLNLARDPRRATDPPTENWGKSIFGGAEDEEVGDMKRAWRVLKWVVIAVGGAFLVAGGDQISHRLFGG